MSESTLLMTETAQNQQAESSQPVEQTATEVETVDQQQQPVEQAETEAKPEEEVVPKGAPEKYEFQVEGINPAVIDKFSEVAKRHGMSQEAAQDMLDSMSSALNETQAEAVTLLKSEWAEAAKADKEIGGDKLSETLAVAKTALDALASQELRQLLNESGLGNHPEVIRLFYKAGKAISQDVFVNGQAGKQPRDPAKTLFPTMN